MTRPILDKNALREAVKFYLDQDDITFDTETKGEYRLDPRRNQVFWISLAAQGRADVVPFGHPIGHQIGTIKEPRVGSDGKTRMFTVPVWSKPPEQLYPGDVFEILEPLFFDRDKAQRLWGHNVKFDLESVSKYYDGDFPLPPYGDTMVAAFLCNENFRTYRLGDIVKRDFGFVYDKAVGKEVERYPFKVAANYGFLDAKYTHLLRNRYLPKLERAGMLELFELEMDVLGALCRMEEVGSPLVDIEALRALDADLDVTLAEIRGRLYRIVGRQWNFKSNPQKVEIFYGKKRDGGRGLRPKKYTPGGAPSTDAEALEHHEGDELVDTFKEFQEVDKISTNYVKSYLGTNEGRSKDKSKNNAPPYNPDTGRIHTNFKQSGTVTGRFSSSEPNVQNIPRPDTELGQRIRGLFVAEPGHKLIVADWSQVEYRILAFYSEDKKLVQAFEEGLDFHQYVASMLLGKSMDDVTKVERTVSKNTNFAVAYGASVPKVASMSGVTVREAEEFLYAHKKMLPGMYAFCDKVVRTCRSRRPPYVKTLLGRKRRLPDINLRPTQYNFGKIKAAERQAVNAVIQGSAADLMKLAIVREDALLQPGMAMNFTVHDELVTSVRDDQVEAGVAVVTEAMMGWEIAKLIHPVRLEADIKVVERWSDAKG